MFSEKLCTKTMERANVRYGILDITQNFVSSRQQLYWVKVTSRMACLSTPRVETKPGSTFVTHCFAGAILPLTRWLDGFHAPTTFRCWSFKLVAKSCTVGIPTILGLNPLRPNYWFNVSKIEKMLIANWKSNKTEEEVASNYKEFSYLVLFYSKTLTSQLFGSNIALADGCGILPKHSQISVAAQDVSRFP